MATGRASLDETRFWSKVEVSDGCWLWLSGLNQYGYGRFSVARRMCLAHRYSYELNVGPIPEGLVLDHLCRTPRCVRPDHLEPVTQAVNLERGLRPRGVAHWNGRKTHCHKGHAFD